MAFQFKNKETNKVYYINEIDEIAAKFWGKEVHPHEYAYPGKGSRWGHAPNWFDVLGHTIENLQYFHRKNADGSLFYLRSCSVDNKIAEFDMAEIASLLVSDNTRYCSSTESILESCESMKPYLEFCFHLRSLNIIGVGCGW